MDFRENKRFIQIISLLVSFMLGLTCLVFMAQLVDVYALDAVSYFDGQGYTEITVNGSQQWATSKDRGAVHNTDFDTNVYIKGSNRDTDIIRFDQYSNGDETAFAIKPGQIVVVENVTIYGNGMRSHVFDIGAGGKLVLINVTIDGGNGKHGVILEQSIGDEHTRLITHNTTIKNCGMSAVSARDNTEFTLTNCIITNNGYNRQGLEGGSSYPGISTVGNNITGTITRGEISSNAGHGISNGDNLNGKYNKGDGIVTCNNVTINDNGFSGSMTWFTAQTKLSNCTIKDNKNHGVEAICDNDPNDKKQANLINVEISNCTISDNKSGVHAECGKGLTKVNITGQRTVIEKNKEEGIHVSKGASVTMNGGRVSENVLAGVKTADNSIATLTGVSIRGNQSNGVITEGSSDVKLINNTVSENGSEPLRVLGTSTVKVTLGSLTPKGSNDAIRIERNASGAEDAGVTIVSGAGVYGTIFLAMGAEGANDKEYVNITDGVVHLTIKADNAFEGRKVVQYSNIVSCNNSTLTSADSANYTIYKDGNNGRLCTGHTITAKVDAGNGAVNVKNISNGTEKNGTASASLEKVFIYQQYSIYAGNDGDTVFTQWNENGRILSKNNPYQVTLGNHGNHTYTASTFTAQNYILKFDANWGMFNGEVATHRNDSSGFLKEADVRYGQNWYSINQTGAYKPNQEFLGWTLTKDGDDFVFDRNGKYVGKSVNPNSPWSDSGLWEKQGNELVYARFGKLKTATIKFNADGGTPGQSDVKVTVGSKDGYTVNTPSKLDSSGRKMEFLGWARTDSSWNFIKKNGSYDIVYESGAGTGSHGKSGDYWSADGKWCYAGSDSTIYVKAVYRELATGSVTVKFDGNGAYVTGTGRADITQKHGTTVSITPNNGEYIRPGYKFMHWSDIASDTVDSNGNVAIKGNQYSIDGCTDTPTAIAGITQDATENDMPINGIYNISGQDGAGLWSGDTTEVGWSGSGMKKVYLANYDYTSPNNKWAMIYNASKKAYKFVNVATGLALDYYPHAALNGQLYQYTLNDQDTQYWKISRIKESDGTKKEVFKNVTYSNKAITVSKPSLIAKDFSGANNLNKFTLYFNQQVITSMTLYAHWQPYRYRIIYNANGGSGTVAPTTGVYSDAAGITVSNSTFSKTGYTQDGWSRGVTNGAAWSVYAPLGQTFKPSKNLDDDPVFFYMRHPDADGLKGTVLPSKDNDEMTLYAHWVPNETKVTIKGKNCTVGNGGPYTMTYDSGSNSSLNIAGLNVTTAGDYRIDSYEITDRNGSVVYTYSRGASSVSANKSNSRYWDSNGKWVYNGRNGESLTFYITAVVNTAGYKVEHYLQNADDDGYTHAASDDVVKSGFIGAKPDYEVKAYEHFAYVSGKTEVPLIKADSSAVVKLYYDRDRYAVELNKGTGISTVSGGGSYKYGQTVSIKAVESEGYAWSGWTGYAASTENPYVFAMPGNNVSFTANAAPRTYNIHFDANGGIIDGSVTTTDRAIAYKEADSTIADRLFMSSERTMRDGYTLTGWNMGADGSGELIFDADGNALSGSVWSTSGLWIGTDNITVYAQWRDTREPEIRVTPDKSYNPDAANNAVKNIDVTITVIENGSGLSQDNDYEYGLSRSASELPENWYKYSTTSPATDFDATVNIGDGMNGTYYLWVKQISDCIGNKSISPNMQIVTVGDYNYHVCGTYTFDNLAPAGTVSYIENNQTLGIEPENQDVYALLKISDAADEIAGVSRIYLKLYDAANPDNSTEFDFTGTGTDYELKFFLYDKLSDSEHVEKVNMAVYAVDAVGNEGELDITEHDFGTDQVGSKLPDDVISFSKASGDGYERDYFRVEARIENVSYNATGIDFMCGHFGELRIYTFGYVESVKADFGSIRSFIREQYDYELNLPLTALNVSDKEKYVHRFKIPLYAEYRWYTDTVAYGYKGNSCQERYLIYNVYDSILKHVKTIYKY